MEPNLTAKIKALNLDGDIADDEATLTNFSHDASVFEVRPEVVVSPRTVADLEKIVSFVSSAKAADPGLSITPRSAGTCMSGGSLNTSIILDFLKYFNHTIEVAATGTDTGYGVVEPGVFYRDFEKLTLQKNLLLPPYPASRDICAVGGQVANNGAGEKTLTYGKIEDYVEELRMVLADGKEHTFTELNRQQLDDKLAGEGFESDLYRKIYEIVDKNYDAVKAAKPKVSKNSAGYYLWNVYDRESGKFNMNKLLVGSQGTLGIIDRIKFRLVQPDTESQMLVVFMQNLDHLAELVNVVLGYKPESFESYDDKTLKLALKFFPEVIKIMKPKNLFSLAWQFLPEVRMILRGGMPKLVLMAEFRGKDMAEVATRTRACSEAIARFNLPHRIADQEDSQKYWTIRRESFSLLRKHMRGTRTAPFIDDIIVEPKYLPEFLPQLNKILAQYDIIYTIAGHVGNGNFHIIPLMDFKKPETKKIIPELSKKVYDLVLSYHGSITAEHNDGLIRSPYLKQMYGPEIYGLFEQVKKAFDPLGIFNPGKKVGSDLGWAMDHMVKE